MTSGTVVTWGGAQGNSGFTPVGLSIPASVITAANNVNLLFEWVLYGYAGPSGVKFDLTLPSNYFGIGVTMMGGVIPGQIGGVGGAAPGIANMAGFTGLPLPVVGWWASNDNFKQLPLIIKGSVRPMSISGQPLSLLAAAVTAGQYWFISPGSYVRWEY